MRISDDAFHTRNKFIAQLDSMDDIDLKRRYNEAISLVLRIRYRMEKDASDFLSSLKHTDKNSLHDEWCYDVGKISRDYEDWLIYRDVAISAKALIEFREREKRFNNEREAERNN